MSKFNAIPWIREKVPAGLFLLLLAPFIGELLSAHQAPPSFFNPLSYVITCLPYGFGAIIVRELMVRWGGGMVSFFLLALAFGVYEEGIVVRSFFNPEWSELGPLQDYNFVYGINWTFSFVLLHFHVVFSIWSSINIAELVYRDRQKQSWVGNKLLGLSVLGLLLWWPTGWMMTSFVPPTLHYAAVIALFVALVLFARVWSRHYHPSATTNPKAAPPLFYLLGAANVIIVFFTVFIAPDMGIFPPLPLVMLFLVAVNVATFIALSLMTTGFTAWDDRSRLAFSAGILILFFIISPLKDLEDGFAGSTIVALVAILFLLQLNSDIKKSSPPTQQ